MCLPTAAEEVPAQLNTFHEGNSVFMIGIVLNQPQQGLHPPQGLPQSWQTEVSHCQTVHSLLRTSVIELNSLTESSEACTS